MKFPRVALMALSLSVSLLSSTAFAGWDEGLAAYQANDYRKAFRELRPLAVQGNVKAQYVLGGMYYEGQGVPQDIGEAAKMFRLASDQGLAPAMSNLGVMYVNGQGVPQSYEEAAKWFRQGADKGDKRSQFNLGVAYGISFTATLFNQAGALVHVYTDGSVQVNHGGTEMGQGLNTKVAQIVADELGVPFARVLCTASDTSKIPNASATAASAGTDLNGRAAQFAARHVRDNLAAFVCGLDGCGAGAVRFAHGRVTTPSQTRSFDDVVKLAYANRIQLWSDGFYRTPKIHYDKATLTGRPFYYFAYGAACTEVAIDTLTGESRVLKVDILHDVGQSINPAIDIGQIEGGFVQGMGWLTTEQLVWNDKGYLTTHAPSTYKIPTAGDVPEHFKVDLWHEPNVEDNVFGSKAVGEPPFMLAISVYEALRDAIGSVVDEPVRLAAPATAENVLRALNR